MKKNIKSQLMVLILTGLVSPISMAADCNVLNGLWRGTEQTNEENMESSFTISATGKKIDITNYVVKSISENPWVYTGTLGSGTCSINIKAVTLNLIITSIKNTNAIYNLNLSEDLMSFDGSFKTSKGVSGKISMKRTSAPPKRQSSNEDSRDCIIKNYSYDSMSYTLKNICNDVVNLKYTFSRSKPFSGTYTTLQPDQETFETAKKDEKYLYKSCFSPQIPTDINGKCN